MSYTIKQAVDMMPYWYEDRANNIYLLMGGPGIGKTEIVRQFAEKKGVNVVTLLASQSVPNEIAGTNGPDLSSDVMKYYEPTFLRQLKDGDILFMDELLTAPASNLAACLTMMQSRVLQGDKKLPDVMIICASNNMPVSQVSAPLRDRFWKIDIRCDKDVAAKYLASKYGGNASKLAPLITECPDDKKWNWTTPRSVEKLISQVSKMIPKTDEIEEGSGVWDFVMEVTDSYVTSKFAEYWNNRVRMLEDDEYRERCEKVAKMTEDISDKELVDTIKEAAKKAMVESKIVYDITGIGHNDCDKTIIAKLAEEPKEIPLRDFNKTAEHVLAERGCEPCEVSNTLMHLSNWRTEANQDDLDWVDENIHKWPNLMEDIVEEYNQTLFENFVDNSFDEMDLSTIIGTLQKLPIWDNISDILASMNLIGGKE